MLLIAHMRTQLEPQQSGRCHLKKHCPIEGRFERNHRLLVSTEGKNVEHRDFPFAVLLENNLARCKIQTTTLCSSITEELMFYLKLYLNRSSNTPGKRGMLNVYVSKFEIFIISDSVL